MSKAKNATEVLQAAEWIIDNIGWTQYASFRDKIGLSIGGEASTELDKRFYHSVASVCLTGAINLVNASKASKAEALARLRLDINIDDGALMDFNDEPGRTKEQVLAVVQEAIKRHQ